jgi:hypothetical protein
MRGTGGVAVVTTSPLLTRDVIEKERRPAECGCRVRCQLQHEFPAPKANHRRE